MRFTILITIFLVLLTYVSYAQNLVPNPSFENKITCPYDYSQVRNFCTDWHRYTSGTPDFFDTCTTVLWRVDIPENSFGYQHAVGGAYAGIYSGLWLEDPINSSRAGEEYLATQISPLQVGRFYEVSISVSLANRAGQGSDGLGVYFYRDNVDSLMSSHTVPWKGQVDYSRYGVIMDTTKWVRLKGYLLADSAYGHVVIGQLKDSTKIKMQKLQGGGALANRSYYYIDSVVVRETANLNIEVSDSMLCVGDTVLIGCFVNPTYFNAGNIFSVELSDANGNFVSPTIIGSISGKFTDTIKAVIPNTILPSDHYRLRLTSTNPGIISDDNGEDIRIGDVKPVISSHSNAPLCNGDTLRIVASSSTPNILWRWWRSYQYPQIDTFTTLVKKITDADTGIYFVAASNGGCMSKIDTHAVYVIKQPFVDLSVKPLNALPGTQLTFTAQKFVTPTDKPKYQWYKNGISIPNAIDTFYKADLGSSFKNGDTICVEISSGYSCPLIFKDIACISYSEYLGIRNMQVEKVFSVYPNPAKSLVNFERKGSSLNQPCIITIMDLLGQTVGFLRMGEASKVIKWNTETVASGIYLYKVVSNEGLLESGRLVISK